jgi:2,3-bisphosphoglycerate-dependent phosphoglycerate mutase
VLILVRHAMPESSPTAPPTEWPLSADGRRAAAALRVVLPQDARLVASTEPKAWQTLGDVTEVVCDHRFCEVDRPVEPWSDDFRTRRAEYVSGTVHEGWEPHPEVARRFDSGVIAHADGGPQAVVIATHGMAMTVWLVSVGAVAESDAEAFWRALRFPDAHLVDVAARTVRRWPQAARLSEQSGTPNSG